MATQQVQGRAWPGARSLAPLADNEARGPVAQDQSDPDADQDLVVVTQRCFSLGGGNPKVMYLNYQLALAKEAAACLLFTSCISDGARMTTKQHIAAFADAAYNLQREWDGLPLSSGSSGARLWLLS